MKTRVRSAIPFFLLSVTLSKAAELKQTTLLAWDNYIASVKKNVAARNAGSLPFLSVDESPESRQRVQNGELLITNHDPRNVPHGLIHDWVGDMFVPNVSLDQVMQVLNRYDRFADVYKPLIRKTSVIGQSGDTVTLNVVAVQKAFSVTAAVETDVAIETTRPAPDRICIVADSVRIYEIADYGQRSEHVFPEARRPGYVWRSLIVQRLEQRDGGVYVELEAICLSRGIPPEVRWLIRPLTNDLPRKIIIDLLDETRAAVQQTVEGEQTGVSREFPASPRNDTEAYAHTIVPSPRIGPNRSSARFLTPAPVLY